MLRSESFSDAMNGLEEAKVMEPGTSRAMLSCLHDMMFNLVPEVFFGSACPSCPGSSNLHGRQSS